MRTDGARDGDGSAAGALTSWVEVELPHVSGELSMAILLPDIRVKGDLNAMSHCLLCSSKIDPSQAPVLGGKRWIKN